MQLQKWIKVLVHTVPLVITFKWGFVFVSFQVLCPHSYDNHSRIHHMILLMR